MLYRKIASLIEAHLQSYSNKILLIDGARQVGKTYIVRYVGQKLFGRVGREVLGLSFALCGSLPYGNMVLHYPKVEHVD